MDIPRIGKRIAELTTIHFGKDIAPKRRAEDGEQHSDDLWNAVLDLANHCRDLEYASQKLPAEAFNGISLDERKIEELVEMTRAVQQCAHATNCDHCGLQIRLIIVRIQLYTRQLEMSLRATHLLRGYLVHEYPNGSLFQLELIILIESSADNLVVSRHISTRPSL
jgi:hypothetical protein